MNLHIAVVPGDGIGPEVMREAVKVLEVLSKKFEHTLTLTEALIGGAAYDFYGEHLPKQTLDTCQAASAILFGSVGGPVADQHLPKWHNAERNALLGIRKHFGFNINIRPCTLYPELLHLSPVKAERLQAGVNVVVIRELIGGIYFGEHKTESFTTPAGTTEQRATDVCQYSESEIKKPLQFAFALAQTRRGKVTVVDKANVLDTSRLWRKVAAEVSEQFSDCRVNYMYIDNAVMQMIQNPSQFDVIVTENMFGDILSDAASVLPGSLGLMPSASLQAGAIGKQADCMQAFGLYEPIGGSAPDIAGKGVANPIAQVLSVALMLRYSFGLEAEAQCVELAVNNALKDGLRTGDIAKADEKRVTTEEMGNEICARILNL